MGRRASVSGDPSGGCAEGVRGGEREGVWSPQNTWLLTHTHREEEGGAEAKKDMT